MNPRRIDPKDFPKEGSQEAQIRFILAFAVLAPSTHNTQPWLFKIEGDTVHIYANKEYLLPKADKQRRDFFISFGCLFENLVTAGEYFKVLSELTIRDVSGSDGSGGAEGSKDFDFSKPIASARFIVNTTGEKNKEYERAFNAMLIRINARGVFADVAVDTETKNTILSIAAQFNEEKINTILIDDKEKIKSIAALTKQGLRIAYKDKSFRHEMSGWMNSNLSHKKRRYSWLCAQDAIFLVAHYSETYSLQGYRRKTRTAQRTKYCLSTTHYCHYRQRRFTEKLDQCWHARGATFH